MTDEVLQYLKDNFYLASTPNGLVITNKFIRELGISSSNTKPIAPIPISKRPLATTKEMYKYFIEEAKIPSKIENATGSYWANRYSEPGFKAFKKVFDNPAINRTVLLASTKWYYAQSRTARKMISNYFIDGIWESCYDDFVKARDIQTSKFVYPLTPDQVYKIPKIVDENASNMEAG